MRGLSTRVAALGLSCALTAGLLSGCTARMTAFDAGAYVQGVLDETYKGQWDPVFLDLVDQTEAQAKKAYEEAVGEEYQRFCYQFDLRDSYLTDETRDLVSEFLEELSAKASYSVKTTAELDDTRYAVEVAVRPIELFLQVKEDDLKGFTAEFQEKHSTADLTGADAAAQKRFWTSYENAWARGVVQLCRDKLGLLTYGDVQPILVLVAPDSEGLYGMEDNDFSNLSALILPY